MTDRSDQLRHQILALVREYSDEKWPREPFVAGDSSVPVSGRVFDADEVTELVDSALDFWLTTGRFAARFEREFAEFMEVRHAILVNSGSSANLVALAALTSEKLGDRRLRPGDEVITTAAAFPTTVNPIIQYGLVPVFVDIDIPTYNINAASLSDALSERTRAIMVAHTLGNPFDLAAVTAFAQQHDLWLIEDCCDAVGSTYGDRRVGSFGHLATVSFYPAHHITMGEGGCVLTNDPTLKKIAKSFRDWGRDCWCEPGRDNTCGKRFGWQLGDLPRGYDHKYIYSEIGYNLKVTDMQAAVGVAQLGKIDTFMAARRRNFRLLHDGLSQLEEHLVLPEATKGTDPCWFGFPITVREHSPLDRRALIQSLENHRIGTRLLFAGNITRQPAYRQTAYRCVGDLRNTGTVMDRTFWIGVYPGLTHEAIGYMVDTIANVSAETARNQGKPPENDR